MYEHVLVAVDPHKGHNTLVVLDPVGRRPLEEAEFANTHAGYREMVRFARRWRQRRWAVEGCHGAARYLAQRLVAQGEVVLDVPAKLAARVRVCSQAQRQVSMERPAPPSGKMRGHRGEPHTARERSRPCPDCNTTASLSTSPSIPARTRWWRESFVPARETPTIERVANDEPSVRRFVKGFPDPGLLRTCYEAGPCGYELHRPLTSLRVRCQVIAPALIPVAPGARVKTDKRDARRLVRQFRAGELIAIRVPSRREEALRDLCRAEATRSKTSPGPRTA